MLSTTADHPAMQRFVAGFWSIADGSDTDPHVQKRPLRDVQACSEDILDLTASLSRATAFIVNAENDCSGVNDLCTADISSVARNIGTAASDAAKAIKDCSNSSTTPLCVGDIVNTTAALVGCIRAIVSASNDCGGGANSSVCGPPTTTSWQETCSDYVVVESLGAIVNATCAPCSGPSIFNGIFYYCGCGSIVNANGYLVCDGCDPHCC